MPTIHKPPGRLDKPKGDVVIRLLRKVRYRRKSQCWEFTGYRDVKGYGQISYQGKMQWAHRISFALFNDPIPPNCHVHHICKNTRCVNPDHLMLIDPRCHTHDVPF